MPSFLDILHFAVLTAGGLTLSALAIWLLIVAKEGACAAGIVAWKWLNAHAGITDAILYLRLLNGYRPTVGRGQTQMWFRFNKTRHAWPAWRRNCVAFMIRRTRQDWPALIASTTPFAREQ